MHTVLHTYTHIRSLTSRLSLSVYTVVPNNTDQPTPYPTIPPHPIGTTPTHLPCPAKLRVTALPRAICMSFPHRLTIIHLPRIPGKALFPGLPRLLRHKTRPHPVSLTYLYVSLFFAPRDRLFGNTPRARPRALTGLRIPAVGSPNTCFPGRNYGCP